MIVYHASLSLIKKFNFFNKNGVHFGGLMSAYEAALRKCTSMEEDIKIYKCRLNLNNNFFLSDDVGSHDEWKNVIIETKNQNISIIKYQNKYEPDITPSFIVLKEGFIEILEVSTIKAKKVEKEILFKNYI